jgi:hypothetical protein
MIYKMSEQLPPAVSCLYSVIKRRSAVPLLLDLVVIADGYKVEDIKYKLRKAHAC